MASVELTERRCACDEPRRGLTSRSTRTSRMRGFARAVGRRLAGSLGFYKLPLVRRLLGNQ